MPQALCSRKFPKYTLATHILIPIHASKTPSPCREHFAETTMSKQHLPPPTAARRRWLLPSSPGAATKPERLALSGLTTLSKDPRTSALGDGACCCCRCPSASPLLSLMRSHIPSSLPPLGRNKTSCNLDPLRNTTSLLPLHIHHIRIASTPTPDSIFFLHIPLRPVLVFLSPSLLVLGSELEVRFPWELASRGVGGAVLDGGVPVAEVAEVMDVFRREEGAGCEGVDGCVAPLSKRVSMQSSRRRK